MRKHGFYVVALLCVLALAVQGSCLAFGKKLSSGCEIYALQYGTSVYPARSVYADDRSGEGVDFAWLLYLVKLDSRIVLVDTGFDDARLVKRFRLQNFTDPVALLAELDIRPEQITDIIITHGHFDHVLLVHKFTRARIHIQERDYNYMEANGDVPSFAPAVGYMKKYPAMLDLLDGDASLGDDIELRLSGGHTFGSQVAVLFTRGKTYYFIGDESYLLEGLRQGKTNALYDSRARNEKIVREMAEKLTDPRNEILPMHDPEIMKRYPRVTPHIVKIL
ncbi:MAG: MBL fold metallo-hydrolase [Spirochaetes bacterium]|nr:MAG: MBL fold metallo-hydrolase [Spirochaetota bacterium]